MPATQIIKTDDATHTRVLREAKKRSLPVWVVATLLLNHALDAVKSGNLKINPPGLEKP